MAKLNKNYHHLKQEYIFPKISSKKKLYLEKHREAKLLNFGIGDITLPLAPSIANAISSAAEEMTTKPIGYGPELGYPFLKEAIVKNEYAKEGISPDEIFISDGTNSDCANIHEIFSSNSIIGISDPTYPLYLDTHVMAGHLSQIVFLPCNEESNFSPLPPKEKCDLIYLCSPSNPTGVAMNEELLLSWIDYAHKHGAILLYDNAYGAFIESPDVPKNIYSLPGAKECVIEFRTFSKCAGFTGLRCAYTVIPKEILILQENGTKTPLYPFWKKRQNTKFNGVSYPMQKGASAYFSKKGQQETKKQIAIYKEATTLLKKGLEESGYKCFGGIDSPYIWVKTPDTLSSWEFFDLLLEEHQIIAIPGSGFGSQGEGYVRFSGFTTAPIVREAISRLSNAYVAH